MARTQSSLFYSLLLFHSATNECRCCTHSYILHCLFNDLYYPENECQCLKKEDEVPFWNSQLCVIYAYRSVERGALEVLLWRTSVAVRCTSSCFSGHTRVYQLSGPLILCVSGSIGSSYQEINPVNAPSV